MDFPAWQGNFLDFSGKTREFVAGPLPIPDSPVRASHKIPDVESMIALGRELASRFRGGEVIALCGPLGAGKTQLTKGIAAGLGCEAVVTSPTFTLVHEYRGGRLPLTHLDFYRLESALELEHLGWDELLDLGGVVVAEWADKFPEMLPPGSLWGEIEILPGAVRRLTWRDCSGSLDSTECPEHTLHEP